jgi:hypothetical protein
MMLRATRSKGFVLEKLEKLRRGANWRPFLPRGQKK